MGFVCFVVDAPLCVRVPRKGRGHGYTSPWGCKESPPTYPVGGWREACPDTPAQRRPRRLVERHAGRRLLDNAW